MDLAFVIVRCYTVIFRVSCWFVILILIFENCLPNCPSTLGTQYLYSVL